MVLVGKLGRNGQLEDLGLDGDVIFIRISQKQDMRSWTVFFWLRTEVRAGLL